MKRLFTWGAPLFALLALTLSLFSQADTKPSTIDSTSANYQQATLAGGCFWCTESDMEKLPGVVDVISGYAGGDVDNPTYKQVSSGKTGHIEVIQVTFDPKIVTYEQVLDQFFRHIDQPMIKARLWIEVSNIARRFSITTPSNLKWLNVL